MVRHHPRKAPHDVTNPANAGSEIANLGAGISNASVPTDGNQDFITVKFRVNPPSPGATDPSKCFIRACLGLQDQLVEAAKGLDLDVFGVSIATGGTTAQVWESSQHGLMNGHIATCSPPPRPPQPSPDLTE